MTTEKFKVAILDDFEELADTVPAYQKLRERAEVAILRKRLATSEHIVATLRDFDAILLMSSLLPRIDGDNTTSCGSTRRASSPASVEKPAADQARTPSLKAETSI